MTEDLHIAYGKLLLKLNRHYNLSNRLYSLVFFDFKIAIVVIADYLKMNNLRDIQKAFIIKYILHIFPTLQ